jgi:hypothetical protein
MLKALASVKVKTICKWENHVHRWMDAYETGLITEAAQAHVKKFSSCKYKSHRCIPNVVAAVFDAPQ